MSVDRSEVSEIKAFEEVALFQDGLFDDIAEILQGTSEPGHTRGSVPDFVFEAVVTSGGGNAEEVFFKSADIRADRHVVIIEDNEHVGIGSTGIVESFIGESAGESAIADNGDDVTVKVE